MSVIECIWNNNYLEKEKLPDDFVYSETAQKFFIMPMFLPALCPFVVTGEVIFNLLFELKFYDENNSPQSLMRDPISGYKNLYDACYGENGFCKKLGESLYLNTEDLPKGKNTDSWRLFEIFRYIDIFFKKIPKYQSKKDQPDDKRRLHLLLNIIKDFKNYCSFSNELLFEENNPSVMKVILLKSILFHKLDEDKQFAMSTLGYIMKSGSVLLSSFYYFAFIPPGMKAFKKFYISPELNQNVTNDVQKDFLKKLLKYEFDEQKINSGLKILQPILIILNFDLNNIKNERKDCLIFVCLFKLLIYEQMIRFSAKIIDENFLILTLSQNKEDFIKATQKIIFVSDDNVSIKDWKKYFKEYSSELKIIFPDVNEKDLSKLWEQACRLLLYLNSVKFNFDFQNNRLRFFHEGRSSKLISDDKFNDGHFKFNEIVVTMDMIKIGEIST